MVKVTEVVVEKEGTVLLPPGRIVPILADTPDEQVTITEANGTVVLTSGDSEVRIRGEDPADFTALSDLPDEGIVEVDPDVLKYMVRRTAFAVAPEKGRYALNGVLFVLGAENSIEMVAADGSRLALTKKKVSNPDNLQTRFIVPVRAVEQLARLGEYGDEPVRFAATDSELIAQNDVGRLVCQLMEGQFPNYQEVIPSDSKVKVPLPVKELLSAVRRAHYMTTDDTRVVDFCFAPGQLTIRAESPDVGRAEIKLAIEYDGEEAKISFNPEYIEDMVSVVERDNVTLRFTDQRSPCVIKSGYNYTYVISPVVREEAGT